MLDYPFFMESYMFHTNFSVGVKKKKTALKCHKNGIKNSLNFKNAVHKFYYLPTNREITWNISFAIISFYILSINEGKHLFMPFPVQEICLFSIYFKKFFLLL